LRAGKLSWSSSGLPPIVVDLSFDIAVPAGKIDVERKRKVRNWGLADSIILAIARASNAKVVTGDEHFADLIDEVVMIE